MPISQQFVRMMGGEIAVSSKVGEGSVFTFDIPVEIAEAADVPTAHPARRVIGLEPGQPVFRILVVEDEEANRRLLITLLQPFGFDLREVTNGQEALATLPAEWLETLKQGARRADFLLLSSVIEQIREQDATLASALAQLAEDFDYDSILRLLRE